MEHPTTICECGKGQPDPSRKLHPAYVAGYVDADGCIFIGNNGDKTRYWSVHVVIQQKEQLMIDMLKEQYGGAISLLKRKVKDGRIFHYHRWDAVGSLAINVLEDIPPYIVEKREQAELALMFAKRLQEFKMRRHIKGKMGIQPTLTEDEMTYRDSIKARVSSLNTCHKFRAGATTEPSEDGVTPVHATVCAVR